MFCSCGNLVIAIGLLLSIKPSLEIQCKDENNRNIDWYINYKLPRDLNTKDSKLRKGFAYASLTSLDRKEWRYSSYRLYRKGSMLWNTLDEFYANEKNLTYIFYNDQPPNVHTKKGASHMKGIMAFDKKVGIWIMHSIPKFAENKRRKFPKSSAMYGQMVFCVTFKTSELNKICSHLLYCGPNIYYSRTTNEVVKLLSEKSASLFSKNPDFVTELPFTKKSRFKSKGGLALRGFAKDNDIELDIYKVLIAPSLRTSLILETWRRGKDTLRRRRCEDTPMRRLPAVPQKISLLRYKRYTTAAVLDASFINIIMTTDQGSTKTVGFDSLNDHSKWAVSKKENWICISDLNHRVPQMRRGGGALCFTSSPVAKAFRNIIAETQESK